MDADVGNFRPHGHVRIQVLPSLPAVAPFTTSGDHECRHSQLRVLLANQAQSSDGRIPTEPGNAMWSHTLFETLAVS